MEGVGEVQPNGEGPGEVQPNGEGPGEVQPNGEGPGEVQQNALARLCNWCYARFVYLKAMAKKLRLYFSVVVGIFSVAMCGFDGKCHADLFGISHFRNQFLLGKAQVDKCWVMHDSSLKFGRCVVAKLVPPEPLEKPWHGEMTDDMQRIMFNTEGNPFTAVNMLIESNISGAILADYHVATGQTKPFKEWVLNEAQKLFAGGLGKVQLTLGKIREYVEMIKNRIPDSFATRSILMFLGNPGSGKTTLLNALIWHACGTETNWASGITDGLLQGMTTEKAFKDCGRLRYMDTPGLKEANITKLEMAAAQIKKGLLMGSDPSAEKMEYQLVFVVGYDPSRVAKSEDLATIVQIIKMVPDVKNFGVIFNKAKFPQGKSEEMKKRIEDKFLELLRLEVNSVMPWFHWSPFVNEAEMASNFTAFPNSTLSALKEWIRNLPKTAITSVKDLMIEEFNALNGKIDKLMEENAKLRQKQEDIEKTWWYRIFR